MESGSRAGSERNDEQGLKANAIGFVDGLSIGLASTAPAYSLAAVIGSVVVIVGVQAPAALLTAFVPMFLIAAAFFYMNRADPDAGTTFSWVTRAMGPYAGWIGGWAVTTTGILVVGSLADVGARYFFLLIGADGAAGSKIAVTALACRGHRRDDGDLRDRDGTVGPPPERPHAVSGRSASHLRGGRAHQGLHGQRHAGLDHTRRRRGSRRSPSTTSARSSRHC